jgi:hypothetical protein
MDSAGSDDQARSPRRCRTRRARAVRRVLRLALIMGATARSPTCWSTRRRQADQMNRAVAGRAARLSLAGYMGQRRRLTFMIAVANVPIEHGGVREITRTSRRWRRHQAAFCSVQLTGWGPGPVRQGAGGQALDQSVVRRSERRSPCADRCVGAAAQAGPHSGTDGAVAGCVRRSGVRQAFVDNSPSRARWGRGVRDATARSSAWSAAGRAARP